MLTLPDFTEKKIVFISNLDDNPDELRFSNSNIRLYREGCFINQISCFKVLCLFLIGNMSITSKLIQQAKKFGISIFLLNWSFQTYAEILALAEGNYQIRCKQYRMSSAEELMLAKKIVMNKLTNQAAVLASSATANPKDFINNEKIEVATSVKSLLGIEGSCASQYYKALFNSIGWYRRSPQTKEDIPNFLLDIGYTFLFNYVDSILRLFGFDTYKGVYHKLYFERKSLSCDLMEPLRPLIDRELVKAYHLKIVNEKDFQFKNGAFSLRKNQGLNKKYTRIFAQALMNNRDAIYMYLSSFYYHLINPKKHATFFITIPC